MPSIIEIEPVQSSSVLLTAEQESAVAGVMSMLQSGAKCIRLGGAAGTGKTTLLRILAEQTKFSVIAPTGRAVRVLESKGIPAETVHSAIMSAREVIPDLETFDPEVPESEAPTFRAKSGVRVRGFIVDEASMIDANLFDILSRLGFPVVYVGDYAQLPPVSSPDFSVVAEDTLDFKLVTIHRNAGDIAKLGELIRTGNDWRNYEPSTPPDWPDEITPIVTVIAGSPEELEWRRKADMILAGKNETVAKLNAWCREDRGISDEILTAGDPIMFTQNLTEYDISNGQIAVIQKVHKQEDARIKCTWLRDDGDLQTGWILSNLSAYGESHRYFRTVRSGGQVLENPYGIYAPARYAYAATIHKAQGSEWDTVMLDVGSIWGPNWEARMRMFYTAVTRAKKQLILVIRPENEKPAKNKKAQK